MRWPFVDQGLARKIERADARVGLEYIRAQALLRPESKASALEIAGGIALYAGPGSPVSRVTGLGLSGPVRKEDLLAVEEFFLLRNNPVPIDLCPLADQGFLELLASRGYQPLYFKNTWIKPLTGEERAETRGAVVVREVSSEETELWAEVVAKGFADREDDIARDCDIARPNSRSSCVTCLLAYLDGEPAGGALVAFSEGLAFFSSMSTRPAFRRRGVQRALLAARLALAQKRGCDLAVVHASAQNEASQRNVERAGFRLAYTKVMLAKPLS